MVCISDSGVSDDILIDDFFYRAEVLRLYPPVLVF